LEESLRALRLRRNLLAPILSLPPEVFAIIFSFLHVHVTSETFSRSKKIEQLDPLALFSASHVCHHWREIALNHPLLWTHIDFTAFTSAGAAQILARAKKAPLYFEARVPVPVSCWDDARFSAFQKELQDRISRICHLTIRTESSHLLRTLEGLTSPAPTLECLSLLSHDDQGDIVTVPHTLFDGTAPRLSSIELENCHIGWQSPLFRGLKHLRISDPPVRPSLSLWLETLNEMPQLKTLALYWASPVAVLRASQDAPDTWLINIDIDITVTLPSLTHFEISSTADDCGLALAHLALPALTSLCLSPTPCRPDAGDLLEILPYVARHAHGPQDTHPLQSISFRNDPNCIEILAWALPDMDVELPNPTPFLDVMRSARVAFSVDDGWGQETQLRVFDSLMGTLPLDNLVTLTATNHDWTLEKQFWLRYTQGWPLLRRMSLTASSAFGFREMLLKDNGGRKSPLLPSLTKLVLIDTVLCTNRTVRLCNALMKRVEQGVPLETLDLRTCVSASRPIELLSEIVVDVMGPKETLETENQILLACIDRSLYLDDSSGTEDYDEDDPDTGRDDDEDEDEDEDDREYSD
jgi:hypothetical protein